MTNNESREKSRSPELLELEERFRQLHKRVTIRDHEPTAGGGTVEQFIKLTTKVAKNYSPSNYISGVP